MADLALATPTSLVCFQENSSGPLHLESCVNAIISSVLTTATGLGEIETVNTALMNPC